MINTKGIPTMVGMIDINSLLNSLDLLDAWCWILGFRVGLEERFCNPLRNDSNPGAFLKEYGNTILLYDFAASEFHGMHIITALDYIYPEESSLKRKIERFYVDYAANNIRFINRISVSNKDSFNFFLQSKVRPWEKRDADYWTQFHIHKYQLEFENVFPIEYFLYNTRKNPSQILKAIPLDIAYSIKVNDREKIYRPYADEFKWITNMTQNIIGGKQPFRNRTLWIKKSYKDYQVVVNSGRDARYILAEGVKKLPSSFVKMIVKEFDMIIPLMDNDREGRKAAKRFEEQIIESGGNAYGSWINVGDISDPAELVQKLGVVTLEDELRRIEHEAHSKLSKTIAL